MQESHLKDKILDKLKPNALGQFTRIDVRSIANQLNVKLYRIIYLMEVMEDAGYVVCNDIIKNDTITVYAKQAKLTYKGLNFVTYGGYKKIANKEMLEKYWTITKIVATVIYSLLVLLVAIWGIMAQIQSSKQNDVKSKTKVIRTNKTQ